MWILWLVAALGASPDQVLSRVDETANLRSMLADRNKPSIPRSAYVAAAGGQVQTGLEVTADSPNKKAWGVGVFDVPIGRFWAAINDDGSKVEHTALDYLEILQGRQCQAPRRIFQFLPVPLLTDRWWVVNVRYNEALASTSGGRMREQHWATDGDFTLPTATAQTWGDKGIHVNFTKGSWVLIDIDGTSTLVEYYAWADPGGSVPTSVANSFADSGVADTMKTMASLGKAGPRCPIQ